MYADPTYLPEFSNREDLLLTVSLFDDDTGDPLELSGTARQHPGDFSANSWVVTDGALATVSNSALTIPDFPIGGELLALALLVAPNLPIVAGDPISIASGANSMTGYVTSYVAATGALVCQIGNSFQFEIRNLKEAHDFDFAYTSSWDWMGSFNDYGMILSASLGTGITIIGPGVLQIRFPEWSFRKLCHRTYGAGLTMTDSVDTRQIFIARLPLQFGGVSL
jgi:hypothetical protein